MKNILKKRVPFLLASLLCLSLTACSGGTVEEPIGADWRTWGIVADGGTITRGERVTKVLVCVHKADATFYYDLKEQTPFAYVDYPITLENNAWGMYQGIDFSDLNGDGNSDVTMQFMANVELKMVWFWDPESDSYVFQPDESQIDGYDPSYVVSEPEPVEYLPPAPTLMCDELPFPNMKVWDAISYADGSYYIRDVSKDGQINVVSKALMHSDAQDLEAYLTDCALSLGETDNYVLHTVEKNDEYAENMGYPVYIVTYAASENEDTREWIVFAMDTDSYTYLYGICAAPDAAEKVNAVYPDIFAGLYLSDNS